MGEMVQFKRPDGRTCPGYLASPKAGAGAPGFVCIQEWWGLNEQIKKTADRLAEAGYRALVPDLYRGKLAKASDEASHMMANVNDFEAALKQSKSKFEIYRYDAQHAFMNEARPGVYDAASAKLAWDRTLKFLKNVLA